MANQHSGEVTQCRQNRDVDEDDRGPPGPLRRTLLLHKKTIGYFLFKISAAPPLHGEISKTCKKTTRWPTFTTARRPTTTTARRPSYQLTAQRPTQPKRHEGRQPQRHEGPHNNLRHEGPHNHIRHEGRQREFYLGLRWSRASRCGGHFLLR